MSTAQMKAIEPEVLDALRQITWKDGVLAAITEKLDRKLYQKVNTVMESLGGIWSRGKKAHIFGEDGQERVADAVATGTYDAFDDKKHFQFFETPRELAEQMLDFVLPPCGNRILEPSAGKGAIAIAAARRGAEVWAIEVNPDYAQSIIDVARVTEMDLIIDDFLTMTLENPLFASQDPFPAIVMNPPFTKSQDIAHVLHAYNEFLAPGGKLVAIMAPGYTFRQDKKATEFREWLGNLTHTATELPAGTFKEAGTMVHTMLLCITKPDVL